MLGTALSAIDLTLVAVYLAVVLWIGVRVGRHQGGAEDYFLAGRTLTWPLIGLSLFATNVSSSTLVGLMGSAYTTGVSVYNYEWMAAVVLVVFVVFFLPSYIRTRVFTMPEFLERRFDGRARTYFAAWTIFLNIAIDTAGALYAGALVVQLLVPGAPLAPTAAALALAAGAYTAFGGLRAVVYTDAIQAVLLLGGSALVAALAFGEIGSWHAVRDATPPEMLSLVRPLEDPTMPWLGLLTGVPLLGLYFWGTNQFMVQRVLGARDLEHGRLGALFAGLLKLPVLFLMILPGLFARELFPDLPRGDMVFPKLVLELAPEGVRGVVVTALIAAIMSSIDSTLSSGSTMVTMDFVKRRWPEASGRTLVWVGRATTTTFMILAAAIAPQIVRFSSLWDYLQSLLAYVSPPFLACFVAGVLFRRANRQGAIAALVAGHLSAAAIFVAVQVLEVVELHFLYVAPLLFAVSAAALALVSAFTPPPAREQVEGTVWSIEGLRAERVTAPWYRDYRVLSVLLLLLTALCVVPFV